MKKTQMTNEELCLAFQAGDRQAAEQLYLANYSFIRSIALAYSRRYPELWMDVDDSRRRELSRCCGPLKHIHPVRTRPF